MSRFNYRIVNHPTNSAAVFAIDLPNIEVYVPFADMPREVAELAADDYWYNHLGCDKYPQLFPMLVEVYGPDSEYMGQFEVSLELVPRFTATRKPTPRPAK